MHHLPTLAHPAPFFLQAVEATKALAEATANVSKHAASQGGNSDIYWWLALLFLIAAVILAILLYKSEKGKAGEIQAARAEWAKEMAVNNANADALQKQLKEQYEGQIKRLADEKKDMSQQILEGNTELRKQISRDAQVLEATANSLRAITKTTQNNNANQAEILRVLAILAPNAGVRPALPSEFL